MKEQQYRYDLEDGRTILSPNCLDYARNNNSLLISLEKITAQDSRHITVLPNSFVGKVVDLFMGGSRESLAFHQSILTIRGGEPYIRNGREYIPLDTFRRTASKDEMEYVVTQICTQLALSQLAACTSLKASCT